MNKVYLCILLLIFALQAIDAQTIMQTEANPPGVSNLSGGVYSGFAIIGEPAVGEITSATIDNKIGTIYRLSNNSIVTLNSVTSVTHFSLGAFA